jgi:hypothetical protein
LKPRGCLYPGNCRPYSAIDDRGPIEAILTSLRKSRSRKSPRSNDRGSIEAPDVGEVRGLQRNFPRSNDCGSIEATRTRPPSEPRRHFRDQKIAAPLKPEGQFELRIGCTHLRDHLIAAPLAFQMLVVVPVCSTLIAIGGFAALLKLVRASLAAISNCWTRNRLQWHKTDQQGRYARSA